MLEMLAQVQNQSWFGDTIERVARTPISAVLLFTLACTGVRVGLHYYLNSLSPLDREMGAAKLGRILHDLCDALVYSGILVFLIIRPYGVQTFKIPSASMERTLLVSDFLIVNKAVYRYREPMAGDVVVFKPPSSPDRPGPGAPFALLPGQDTNIDFVKRLVGAPGQVIEIRSSRLYRDGVAISEPYVNEREFGEFKLIEYPPGSGNIIPIVRDVYAHIPGRSIYGTTVAPQDLDRVWEFDAKAVPEGKYLMMGDNRNFSSDSRYWGFVERDWIVGKAWVIFWPLGRFGTIQ